MRLLLLLVIATLLVSCNADIRFFVHIPKTGGTTFRHIFAQDCEHIWTFMANAPGDVKDMPLMNTLLVRDNYTCFQGHMSWDLVERVKTAYPNRRVSTFILAREPTSRLESQYYYEQAIHNHSYTPELFYLMHADEMMKFLGDDALAIIKERATYIGITERYHETLSYLLSVGFLRNYAAAVEYSARKVYRRSSTDEMQRLALNYTKNDRVLYEAAQVRFDHQLTSVRDDELYVSALRELDTNEHTCKNDETGIGSGRCWQK